MKRIVQLYYFAALTGLFATCAGCHQEEIQTKIAAPGQAVVGVPRLIGSQPEEDTWSVAVPVENPSNEVLRVVVRMKGQSSEVRFPLTGFSAGYGEGMLVVIGHIDKRRSNTSLL